MSNNIGISNGYIAIARRTNWQQALSLPLLGINASGKNTKRLTMQQQ